jgi:release factor glutamine methyltransferase
MLLESTMAEWHPLPSRDETAGVSLAWSELNERAELRARRAAGGASLPDMRHLTSQDFQHVYEPSDDTYLLMDAVRDEIRTGRWDAVGCSRKSSSPHEDDAATSPSLMVVLEVGCGSGVPSVVFRNEWNLRYGQAGGGSSMNDDTNHRTDRVLLSFATDVNPKALEVAQRTAEANLGSNAIVFVRCDLASPLLSRLGGQVDVLLFNPPYVPTPDDEVMAGCGIEASWAGGHNGRRVVDRFLPQLAQLLRKPAGNRSGVAYVITVDDNRPDQLARVLRERHGLIQIPLLRRRAYNEHLTVQKITWPSDTPQHSSSPSSGAPPP